MSNNNSNSSASVVFNTKMKNNYNLGLSNLSALRKVVNNIVREHDQQVSTIESAMKETLNASIEDIVEVTVQKYTTGKKISTLCELYTKASQEIRFLNDVVLVIKKNKDSKKISIDRYDELMNMKGSIISMQNKMISGIISSLRLIVNDTSNMVMHLPGLINNLNKNPDLIYDTDFKSDIEKYKAHKEILGSSILNLNKMIEQFEKNGIGNVQEIKKIKIFNQQLIHDRNKLNDKGLSQFIDNASSTELLLTKFFSENGLMVEAENKLKDMNEMITILESRLAEYNANPQNFGSEYNFKGDTGRFDVLPNMAQLNSIGYSHPNTDTRSFVNKFSKEIDNLGNPVLNKDMQIKRDEALKMNAQLMTKQNKANEVLTAFEIRVSELKRNPSKGPIEEVSANKTTENLVNVMAQRQEKDLVSSNGNNQHTNGTHLAVVPVEINS